MLAFVAAAVLAAAPGSKPGASGSKPAVNLPMPPPPPAAAPKAPPPPAPRPAEKREADPAPAFWSRVRLGAAVGPALSLGASGFSTGSSGAPAWLRFVARGTFDLMALGPGQLQALVPVGLQGLGLPRPIQGSVVGFDLMPSIRYTFEAIPDLILYADLGLGVGTYQVTIQQQWIGYLIVGASGFGSRLGAGIEYRLFDQLHLLLEPLGLTTVTTTLTSNNITVTATASQWSLLFGASYRL